MLITGDPQRLLAEVRPGDVLAFDSMASVSGLIQWADRAPTNHVALVTGREQVVMANPATKASPEHAVTAHSLTELLGSDKVLGVRLLRPALDADSQARVAARALEYAQTKTKFAYLDLAFLAPSALMRSYPPKDAIPGVGGSFLAAVLQLAARAALKAIPDDSRSLTCSEFVYRCLIESGVKVQIDDPLHTNGLEGSGWDETLQDQDQDLWDALYARNESLPDLAPRSRSDGEPEPNRVTPGDLWRSVSLTKEAVLVTRG